MNMFGGNTGITYEQLQARKKMADQLRAQNSRTPRNAGEGIHAIARALVARGVDRQASARDKELRDQFNSQFEQISPNTQGLMDLANSPYATGAHRDVIQALLKGAPNYRRGTTFHPGGKAVVGEEGPEVVDIPYGASVTPTFGNSTNFGMGLDPADADFLFELPEPVKADAIRRIKGGEPARGVLDQIFQQQQQMQQYDPASQQRMNESGDLPAVPEIDGRELLGPESSVRPGRFDDANAVQVAQAGDNFPIAPSGVGDQSNINNAAYAFRTFNQALDDYENLIDEGGVALLPGKQKDSIKVARRNLQMQMKELYNLGVLNGPDLDLMNEILIDPNGLDKKILDVLGIADTEDRVDNNIGQVRKIMEQLVEPKLKAMGVEPKQILAPRKPPSELSDEELLKLLQGGG